MKTTRCEETFVALSVWSPEQADLPDEIALHLDECPACMERFNARFPPWHPPEHRAPPAPRQTERSGLLSILAIAAAIGLFISPTSTLNNNNEPLALIFPAESALTFDEIVPAPECPLLHGVDDPECGPEDSEWL